MGLYVQEFFAELNNSENKLSVCIYGYMLHWVMNLLSIIFKVRISHRISETPDHRSCFFIFKSDKKQNKPKVN